MLIRFPYKLFYFSFSLLNSCHQQINILEWQMKRFSQILIGKNSIVDINTITQTRVFSYNTIKTTFISHGKHYLRKDIAKSVGGCSCYTAVNIWNTIMDNAMLTENGVSMICHFGCFKN